MRRSASRSSASTSTGSLSRYLPHTTPSIGAKSNYDIVCAISEARGVSPSVGIAFVNLSTSEAILSQICDTHSYVKTLQKICITEPSTILMIAPNINASQEKRSTLLSTIQEGCPGVAIKLLDRKYWNESSGLEDIRDLAFREDLDAIQVALQGNYYATSSFSAVRKTNLPFPFGLALTLSLTCESIGY